MKFLSFGFVSDFVLRIFAYHGIRVSKPMDTTNLTTVKQLLRKYGVQPNKRLGQNFLVSGTVRDNLVAAAELTGKEAVVEVGGGLGALTVALAAKAGEVHVIERDARLCQALTEITSSHANVTVHCADARTVALETLPHPYMLFGNLPYSTGTRILRRFLEAENAPARSVVTLQKEVAERICAIPPHMSLLSLAVQTLVHPALRFTVPHTAFYPKPEVASAAVAATPVSQPLPKETRKRLMALARRGFTHPRKYLINNLAAPKEKLAPLLEQCDIPPQARAQELSVLQWQCLARLTTGNPNVKTPMSKEFP